MSRLPHLVVALLAIAILAWSATPAAADGSSAAGQGVAQQKAVHWNVPGYWLLAQEHVRKELGLSDKQTEKLQEISQQYYEQIRQSHQRYTAIDWKKLSEAERKQKMEEMRKKSAELQANRQKVMESLKKQVEKVLTEEQLTAVKEMEFCRRAGQMLRNPRLAEALGLNEKQKAQLQKNNQRLSSKMRELQKKTAERALGVLNDKQMKKLRGFHEEGYRSLWKQAAPQTPAKKAAQKPCKKEKPAEKK